MTARKGRPPRPITDADERAVDSLYHDLNIMREYEEAAADMSLQVDYALADLVAQGFTPYRIAKVLAHGMPAVRSLSARDIRARLARRKKWLADARRDREEREKAEPKLPFGGDAI